MRRVVADLGPKDLLAAGFRLTGLSRTSWRRERRRVPPPTPWIPNETRCPCQCHGPHVISARKIVVGPTRVRLECVHIHWTVHVL